MIAWFAVNRVAANVIMVVVLAAGLVSLPAIKKELFPSVQLDIVEISVDYPGADPVTVEETICIRLEEAIEELDDIKSIEAVASADNCTVHATAASPEVTEKLQATIENRLDALTNLPEDAEKPRVTTLVANDRVVSVVVAGGLDELTLGDIGRQMRDDIAALPGVTLVELVGGPDYELAVEVSKTSLERHRLTLTDVAAAIKASSLDLPAGVLRAEEGDIRLRTKGQSHRSEEFEDIIVSSRPDGTGLRIGDLATVSEGLAATDRLARFDGQPAVFVDVEMSDGDDMLEIIDQVRGYVAEKRTELPDDITLTTWVDASVHLESRLSTLSRNAIGGLCLVFLVLLVVLNVELALWVTFGTAFAFLGALLLMPYLDISLNMLSMFAFLLVLGIVVDDAIIVGESIHARAERGGVGASAAVEGAMDVAKPVIFAAATTMIAFAPMLFFTGAIGREIAAIPILIIAILAFSLIESLFVLPAHLSKMTVPGARTDKAAKVMNRAFVTCVQRFYLPAVERAIDARYCTLALFAAGTIVIWSIVHAGWIPMRFQQDVPADWIEATVTLPPGAPLDVGRQVLERMERAALDLRLHLDAESGPDQAGVIRHVGATLDDGTIEMLIETEPSETRDIPVAAIARQWRERIGDVPEAKGVEILSTLRGRSREIELELSARSLETLTSATESLKRALGSYPGVHDISDSLKVSESELDIGLRPEARHFGVTLADVATQVRQAFFGEVVQTIPNAQGDVEVVVRYPAAERHRLSDIETMRVRTEDGADIPFHAIADMKLGKGASTIQRKNGRRTVIIEADVDQRVASARQILDDLDRSGFWRDLRSRYPDLHADTDDAEDVFLQELMRNSVIACLMIYALLAIAFRSYLQPILVLSVIPFGLVGPVVGHAVFGIALSMNSLLGMVAASGVAINDNLVLIDAVNRARQRGMSVSNAIRDAAAARFRPILVTSITTFIGLLPMMLERSLQAQYLVPMSVSLAFGVLGATAVTLILTPSIYVIMDEIRHLATRVPGAQSHEERA